jgi:hypothetical protein
MPMVHVLESILHWTRCAIVQLRQSSRTTCFSMDSASEVYRNHLLTRHVTEASLLVGKQCPRDAGEAVLVQFRPMQLRQVMLTGVPVVSEQGDLR